MWFNINAHCLHMVVIRACAGVIRVSDSSKFWLAMEPWKHRQVRNTSTLKQRFYVRQNEDRMAEKFSFRSRKLEGCLLLLSNSHQNSTNITKVLRKYQTIIAYFFSRRFGKFLPPSQNAGNMIIIENLGFRRGPKFSSPHWKCCHLDDSFKFLLLEKFWRIRLFITS